VIWFLVSAWITVGGVCSSYRFYKTAEKIRNHERSDRLAKTMDWLDKKSDLYVAVREILLWPVTKIKW